MRGPALRPIVIAAGGTGGHFFPAESLAQTLIARGHRVVLMTDARTGARLGPVFSGLEHHVVRGAGIAGRGALRGARAAMSLGAGIVQARRILARLNASVVVGFGGYPCVPPVLAACLLPRRPAVVLHEQNAVLGRANRLCARYADLLALGFENTPNLPSIRSTVTGNPVRPAIAALAGRATSPLPDMSLLVSGGSLGARVFSDVVPDAIGQLPDALRIKLRVVQQCRAEDLPRVRAAYETAGVTAELSPFFNDMAERLSAAHLVVGRAGASTCAELAVIGRAAVLVPLPGAIDDHQMANARALDGACVIAQTAFTAPRLAELLTHMIRNPEAILQSARRIAACGRPNAAEALADEVERLALQKESAR